MDVAPSFRPDDADLGHVEEGAAMLASSLPANPSLEQLRKQAKEFRDLVRTGRPKFTSVAGQLHPHWTDAPAAGWAGFTLADAQLVVARSYGFASWRRLREHVEVIGRYSRSPQRRPSAGADDPVDEFLRLACLTYRPRWRARIGEDPDDVRRQARAGRMLSAYPRIAEATIHAAAALGDLAAASSLLDGDPSLAVREGGPHGWPPLLYLMFSRMDGARPGDSPVAVARLLLAHGADPNAGYLPDGEPPPVTALSGAFHGQRDPLNQPAHKHGPALARLLLDAGADPNDEQALGNAGRYPHDDSHLPLLFAHGLGRGSGGPWRARLGHRVPSPAALVQDELRYAAEMNLTDRVRLLLHHCAEIGIDIDVPAAGPPETARTGHALAVLNGNTEIADLLAAAGADSRPLAATDQLVAACMRADRPTVRRLLNGHPGLATRAIRDTWPSPLHAAAMFDRPDAIRLLCAIGFPVNDERGSALHTAALVGHLDVVRLLVDLGADPAADAVDDTPGQFTPPDRTPMGWARYAGNSEVVAYLASVMA